MEVLFTNILKGLFLVYIGWLFLLYILEGWIIYPRYLLPDVSEVEVPSVYESFWITNEDGSKVEAWYISPDKFGVGVKPTVVLLHGNAEIIDYLNDEVLRLISMGFNVLLPEYRGYGRSSGAPLEGDIVADVMKMLAVIKDKPEVEMSQLIYIGRSIGGGVACSLAKRVKPKALVLLSTFSSMGAMALRYGAPSFLLKNGYKNDVVIKEFSNPLFVAHGKLDKTIPFSHAERLLSLSKNGTIYAVDSDHNDFPYDDKFWEALKAFFINNEVFSSYN